MGLNNEERIIIATSIQMNQRLCLMWQQLALLSQK